MDKNEGQMPPPPPPPAATATATSAAPVSSVVPSAAPAPVPAIPRSRVGCCVAGCVGVPLLLTLIAVGAGAWVAAKAGVARVPVLSRFAYEAHAPVRMVPDAPENGAGLFSTDALAAFQNDALTQEEALERFLTEENLSAFFGNLERLGQAGAGGRLNVALTDAMLTASVRQTAARQDAANQAPAADQDHPQKQNGPFDMARAQLAVSRQRGIELFLPLRDNVQGSSVRMYLRPAVEDGALVLHVAEAWVGNLRVPASLVATFSDAVVAGPLRAAADDMRARLVWTHVEVEDGAVRLEGIPAGL